MTVRLSPGDAAPDFTLPDAHGEPVVLAGLRGSKVILYFYPRAATPGCTTQACDFRDNMASFGAEGYRVLGISPDAPAALERFAQNEGLGFLKRHLLHKDVKSAKRVPWREERTLCHLS